MIAHRVKKMIATIAVLAAVAGLIGSVAGLAGGISFFRSGADPAAALHETGTVVGGAAAVTWREDAPGLPRIMEVPTRTTITSAYLAAWDLRTQGGDAHHLAGPAAAAMQAAPESGIAEADRAHRIRLDFYSADGQLVAFTDTATVTRRVALRNGRWDDTRDELYTVVMVLVDGNWRVRHWLRSSR